MKAKTGKSLRKGFTLIELVVVIAILGILAAIAVPKLGVFTTSAGNKADQTNEKIAKNTAMVYLAEKGNPSAPETWDGSAGQAWEEYLGTWPSGVERVSIGTDGSISVTLQETVVPSPSPSPSQPTAPGLSDQEIVDGVMGIITSLPVTTEAPATEENPRILVPPSMDGVTFTFTAASVNQGGASITISPDKSYAVIVRHENQDRTGSITLQASLNGITKSKTFNVTITSGTGNVTVLY